MSDSLRPHRQQYTGLLLGFFRQEHWSGLPFPSPMRESEVAQSCLTLCDPMDYSTPGIPGLHYLSDLAQTHIHRFSDENIKVVFLPGESQGRGSLVAAVCGVTQSRTRLK